MKEMPVLRKVLLYRQQERWAWHVACQDLGCTGTAVGLIN